MRPALCAAALVLVCLLAAESAAAAVPYQQDWKRAAKKAHFSAVPAPGVLANFKVAPAPFGLAPIDAVYQVFHTKACPRYVHRFVQGNFARSRDRASLTVSFTGVQRSKSCQAPFRRPSGPRVGLVSALGTVMGLYRDKFGSGVSYATIASIGGGRLYLQLVYRTNRGADEATRIVEGLRWVRR
ncbi:MAG: hypothetical protein ACM3UV_01105 [Nocardioidaceae bacterium]